MVWAENKTDQPISVVYAVNDAYVPYLATSIASIIANSSRNNLNFYILHKDISEQNKKILTNFIAEKNNQIFFIEVDDKGDFKDIEKRNIHPIINYRLIVSSLLPQLDKCIFLDVDLIVQGDILELWNIDKYYLAAVNDALYNFNNSPYKIFFNKFNLPKGYKYINGGVTVLNLKKWRADKIEEKFFQFMNIYKNKLVFADQDLLNITLNQNILHLPDKYNIMVNMNGLYANGIDIKTAFILHWPGSLKPWNTVDDKVLFSEVFWQYAKLTPYYNQMLKHNQKSFMQNLLQRFGIKR